MKKINLINILLILIIVTITSSHLSTELFAESNQEQLNDEIISSDEQKSKVITFYENELIPPSVGISPNMYTKVDGYRYINIFVEFDQTKRNEKPVSLGVIFAFDNNGSVGARHYVNFEENFKSPINPKMITVSGKNSWHGQQQKKSSYVARFPIMGPYIQIFPFNEENQARKLNIKAYLTN